MKRIRKIAFSLIEVMVWVFIFTLGMASVYVIVSSTLSVNYFNQNYIIATWLASEQIELVRNIRDSNYQRIQIYNQISPSTQEYDRVFEVWKKYKIENDYSSSGVFPIKVTDISLGFEEWQDKLTSSSMKSYSLCLNSLNRYTYDCWWNSKKTQFYKYISIEPVKYIDWWVEKTINNSFIVKSKVIWYAKWYHEFEVKWVIADWKRL